MVLENFFDWLFKPILELGSGTAVIIISLILTLMINIFYKFFTDQELMKSLKAELKELQKEMKTLKEDPEKFMKVQKKAMEKNLTYMKHSMKPTLITFLPLILIFGWLKSRWRSRRYNCLGSRYSSLRHRPRVVGNIFLFSSYFQHSYKETA